MKIINLFISLYSTVVVHFRLRLKSFYIYICIYVAYFSFFPMETYVNNKNKLIPFPKCSFLNHVWYIRLVLLFLFILLRLWLVLLISTIFIMLKLKKKRKRKNELIPYSEIYLFIFIFMCARYKGPSMQLTIWKKKRVMKSINMQIRIMHNYAFSTVLQFL